MVTRGCTLRYQGSEFVTIAAECVGEGARPMWSEFLSRFGGRNRIQTLNPPEAVNPPTRNQFELEATGVSFSIDAVTPADRPLYTESLQESLDRRFRRKILVLPSAELPVVNAELDAWLQLERPPRAVDKDNARIRAALGSRCHPLIDTVHQAFSQHYPLTLSPDCIWLTIAQGFGHHLAENAEPLRGRLVRHQGRRELAAEAAGMAVSDFEQAIAGFSAQIRDATDPVLAETLICDFTTTTPAIRTASEVVLMDTFATYFAYVMRCVCGIPKITLTGTVEDWQRIRARVEVLDTFDLGWWVSRLRPILDEFVATASGHPRTEFWQAIYKPKRAYATTLATGWITDLFPYLGDSAPRRRNPTLEHEREGMAISPENGVSLKQFPSGLASVPLKLELRGQGAMNADLVAGYFGVRQNPSDLALTPAIGWCVTEPPPKERVLI